ncbi:MAG: type IV secretory system conjugative DNA transfer family protein [Gemmataceae bacterium]|nr:type IV secretory system conjugative DNA transfer family protein [Gemmataceae bacterium]
MLNFFKRKPPPETPAPPKAKPAAPKPARDPWPLDMPVLDLDGQGSVLDLRTCCQNVCILGETGSGKTSSSLANLILAGMLKGFAIIATTVKPDDFAFIRRLARLAGAEDRLMRIHPDEPWRFSPLAYEAARGEGGSQAINIVAMLKAMHEVTGMKKREGRGGEADFFDNKTMQLLRNVVVIVLLAADTVSFDLIFDFLVSLPSSPEQAQDPAWRQASACFRMFQAAAARPKTRVEEWDAEHAYKTIMLEWSAMNDRTRTSILAVATEITDAWNTGVLRLLTEHSCWCPEMLWQEGLITVFDMPLDVWGDVSLYLQTAYVHTVMQAVKRRKAAGARPVMFRSRRGGHLAHRSRHPVRRGVPLAQGDPGRGHAKSARRVRQARGT